MTSFERIDLNFIYLLDQIRATALEGLKYAANSYDYERYQRLLSLAKENYSKVLKVGIQIIQEQFQRELGIITPKVGADAAIVNELNEILVLRRTDDQKWCLPCGWVNVGESPAEAAVRETFEETGINVEPLGYITISCKGPPTDINLHHQVNIITMMKSIKKETNIILSNEHSDYNWVTANDIREWHNDHKKQFKHILDYLNTPLSQKNILSYL